MSAHFDKENEKKIAKEHISELFNIAEETFVKNPELSDEYVKKARLIQMKFRLRMPSEYKRRFCKSCNKYLVPNINSRVRIRDGNVIIYCISCRNYTRIPIKQKIKRSK